MEAKPTKYQGKDALRNEKDLGLHKMPAVWKDHEGCLTGLNSFDRRNLFDPRYFFYNLTEMMNIPY